MIPYLSRTIPYPYYAFPLDQSAETFIQGVARAIDGEYTAIACYAQLAQQAPTAEERDRILEIREDERRHLNAFVSLYVALTGRQPTPAMNETCAASYRDGLVAAFKDEQETVDEYLTLADQAVPPSTGDPFRRAAADEQNHAVWLLYYLTRHGG